MDHLWSSRLCTGLSVNFIDAGTGFDRITIREHTFRVIDHRRQFHRQGHRIHRSDFSKLLEIAC